jgi:hypothetical protein
MMNKQFCTMLHVRYFKKEVGFVRFGLGLRLALDIKSESKLASGWYRIVKKIFNMQMTTKGVKYKLMGTS